MGVKVFSHVMRKICFNINQKIKQERPIRSKQFLRNNSSKLTSYSGKGKDSGKYTNLCLSTSAP